jgi:hypothetical protein
MIDMQIHPEDLRPIAHRRPEREITATHVENAIRPPLEDIEQQPDLRRITRKGGFD